MSMTILRALYRWHESQEQFCIWRVPLICIVARELRTSLSLEGTLLCLVPGISSPNADRCWHSSLGLWAFGAGAPVLDPRLCFLRSSECISHCGQQLLPLLLLDLLLLIILSFSLYITSPCRTPRPLFRAGRAFRLRLPRHVCP